MKSTLKFVLFRHAHKSIMPFEDPELSLQGIQQASAILELVKKHNLPRPTRLYVSTKKRTAQTFSPLSKEYNLSIDINADLDLLNTPSESALGFKKRVQNFLLTIESLQQESPPSSLVIYACTHYDWIEESMTLINCDKDLSSFEFSHWSPAQYIVFELKNNLWYLTQKGCAMDNTIDGTTNKGFTE